MITVKYTSFHEVRVTSKRGFTSELKRSLRLWWCKFDGKQQGCLVVFHGPCSWSRDKQGKPSLNASRLLATSPLIWSRCILNQMECLALQASMPQRHIRLRAVWVGWNTQFYWICHFLLVYVCIEWIFTAGQSLTKNLKHPRFNRRSNKWAIKGVLYLHERLFITQVSTLFNVYILFLGLAAASTVLYQGLTYIVGLLSLYYSFKWSIEYYNWPFNLPKKA